MAICDRCGRNGSSQFGTAYTDKGQQVLACSNGSACRRRREANRRTEDANGDEVPDLMEALKRSVDKARSSRTPTTPDRSRP